MRKLIILSLFALSTNISCTAYESDAHEFLEAQGKFDEGRIVISSTDIFEESFCMADKPNFSEFAEVQQFVLEGSLSDLLTTYDVYKNKSEDKVKVNFKSQSLTYTCLFQLKHSDLSAGNVQFLIDEGLQSLIGTRD